MLADVKPNCSELASVIDVDDGVPILPRGLPRMVACVYVCLFASLYNYRTIDQTPHFTTTVVSLGSRTQSIAANVCNSRKIEQIIAMMIRCYGFPGPLVALSY